MHHGSPHYVHVVVIDIGSSDLTSNVNKTKTKTKTRVELDVRG